MLTNVYPSPDIKVTNNTNVCHYFAKEWIKMGYEVVVIYNYPIYLRILHFISNFFSAYIASKFNTSVSSLFMNNDKVYDMDGVKVIRIPLFKPFPRLPILQHTLKKHIEKIATYCNNMNFKPDVITSHFFYPHIPMIIALKARYFHKAKTCVVMHKQNWKMLKYIGKDPIEELKKIDVIGFRSQSLKQEFITHTNYIPTRAFQCYSGVPSSFFETDDLCTISSPINKFIYVGSFIRRKYPEKILYALKKSSLHNFQLDYIGDGVNRPIIENFVKQEGWQGKVHLHGFIERSRIPSFIVQAQCFIMISKEETFGLVYLEAMSKGCITIASRNEGMDGIIEDGVNGFLCEAGNENELCDIINRIQTMSEDSLKQMSAEARRTALELTDSNVAKNYIENLC